MPVLVLLVAFGFSDFDSGNFSSCGSFNLGPFWVDGLLCPSEVLASSVFDVVLSVIVVLGSFLGS